jgi:hypothetical protein
MFSCNPLKFVKAKRAARASRQTFARRPALSATLSGIAFAAGLALMASPAGAQERTAEAAGPFQTLAGTWTGSGLITMKDGAHERIHCRGTYAVQSAGNSLQQELRCASDSYKFEMSTNITQSGDQLVGNWTENTRHVAGRVSGRATPTQILARAEGDTFTAILAVTTRGDRQTVTIQSPGSEVSEVTIALARGR